MKRNGVGFVWRAAEFEILEAFVQANGTTPADKALVEGTLEGLHYLGADHYWTNDNASGHLFAGVKKIQRLGILRATYGRAHTIDFPAGDSNTYLSGRSFYSRIDIGHLTPAAHAGLVFDINVA
jgi:hypothetical protein